MTRFGDFINGLDPADADYKDIMTVLKINKTIPFSVRWKNSKVISPLWLLALAGFVISVALMIYFDDDAANPPKVNTFELKKTLIGLGVFAFGLPAGAYLVVRLLNTAETKRSGVIARARAMMTTLAPGADQAKMLGFFKEKGIFQCGFEEDGRALMGLYFIEGENLLIKCHIDNGGYTSCAIRSWHLASQAAVDSIFSEEHVVFEDAV